MSKQEISVLTGWLTLAAIVIGLLVISFYVVPQKIILPSFSELEQQEAQKNITRCTEAIEAEIDALSLLTKDWAIWDDTYAFMHDKNEEYIKANCSWPYLIDELGNNLLWYANEKGEIVWGEIKRTVDEKPLEIPPFNNKDFIRSETFYKNPMSGTDVKGIMHTNYGIIMISSHAVHKSDGSGDARGVIMMGRFIDQERAELLTKRARVDFTLDVVNDNELKHGSDTSPITATDNTKVADLHPGQMQIEYNDKDNLTASSIISDIFGQEHFRISARLPRDIMKRGRASADIASLSLGAATFIIGIIGAMLMARTHALAKREKLTRKLAEDLDDAKSNLEMKVQLRTEELAETIEQLQDEQRKLIQSEKLAAVGTLASGIAHEFNNINTSILGYSELCLKIGSLDEPYIEYLNRIMSSALKARDITHKILSFVGDNAGIKNSAQINSIINDILRLVENEFDCEGIVIEKRLGEVPDCRMNSGEIGQVALNLITNAAHASAGQEERRIIVESGREGDFIWFSITDNGCGIPEINKKSIFTPFFSTKGEYCQTDSPLALIKGTGLGLSVSHTIVDHHDGEIIVESEEGKGSKFTVRIPLQESDKAEGGAQKNNAAPEEIPELPHTIMILDDEKEVRGVVRRMLTLEGFRVIEAEKGQDALDILERKEDNIEVVLVDMQMPGMNGLSFLKKAKELGCEVPPFIVVTGKNMKVDHPEIREVLDNYEVLAKPFVFDELLTAIMLALTANNKG
ncbi:MAG: response regulator [Planctomycetes bacterium]|nr:response regulator [Planctomycetota bacterium]